MPSFSDYWSNQPALGNTVIKNSIGRDRCKFLLSKLYFAHPKKPANASKIYYIEDVLHCVKQTFREYREDSHIQSIDEVQTTFHTEAVRVFETYKTGCKNVASI